MKQQNIFILEDLWDKISNKVKYSRGMFRTNGMFISYCLENYDLSNPLKEIPWDAKGHKQRKLSLSDTAITNMELLSDRYSKTLSYIVNAVVDDFINSSENYNNSSDEINQLKDRIKELEQENIVLKTKLNKLAEIFDRELLY